MIVYRTKDGDMLDAICAAHYGDTDMLNAVYAANPKLASKGVVFQKGILINLPEKTQAAIHNPIRLWGNSDAG